MNTILLQKILDILTEGLAHVGNFFKDLFVSDPQDGQVIAYDAETGHWINKDATEVELDLINTFAAQPIATLTDGAENIPMKSLVVDIVPKQASGTPTPSNPLPITGVSSVDLTHTGKNLFDLKQYCTDNNISYTEDNGVITFNANLAMYNNPFVFSDTDIAVTLSAFSMSGTSGNIRFQLLDSSDNVISIMSPSTPTVTGTGCKIRFNYSTGGTVIVNNPICYTTAETKTIALGQTVYGGVLDVENGKLVITHAMKNISDMYFDNLSTPESHIFSSNYTQYLTGIKCPATNNELIGSISEQASEITYTQISASDNGKYALSIENTNRFVMIDTACSTVSDFITAHGNDKIVYPLATPIEYTLTPTQIKTRGGTESIFADCGDVSGEYYTKTAAAIKDLVTFTDDITSQITENTTDWSNVQYKVVKNNNVVTVYIYSATTTEHGSVELFSGLPRAAYNGPVLLYDTDNNAVVNAKVDTSGYLDVTLAAGGTVKGTITYVAK